jgi:uncharacterized membrane protein YkoI
MKAKLCIGLSLCVFSAALLALADEPRASVPVEVPLRIKQAVDREIGNGHILGLASAEDPDDKSKLIYVAHAEIDGWAYTVRFDMDGTLIDNECDEPDPDPKDISMDDLPQAVRDKMKSESAGNSTSDPTRQDIPSVYEVQTQIGNHSYSIRVDADGHLLSKERDDEDEPAGKKTT